MSTPESPAPHPGSAVAGSQFGLPDAGTLSPPATAAPLAPDVAVIAQLANAFFAALPNGPAPEPGAALGSAPLFVAEPLQNAIPGTPALTPSYKPNHNPGAASPIPTVGAARPSAPIFALDPGLTPEPAAARAPAQPQGLTVPLVTTPVAPPAQPSPPSAPSFTRDTDLAALPGRLDDTRSLAPRYDAPNAGPFGGSFAGASEPLYFLAGNPALARATPAVAPPSPPRVETLDLGALAAQHRTDVAVGDLPGLRAFDANLFRRDFPILRETVNGRPLIWLDNGATTQKPQCVIDRLAYFYAHENSNIHRAAHTLAARSTDAYEAARDKVRGFINAPSVRDIVFVRGATEAINLVAQAWGRRNVGEGDEIVVSHLEHHANIVPWQQLAAEKGARLRVAPVDNHGQIILEEYEKLLNPRTRIVAFTQVSNALGTVTPVAEMTALAHRHGAKVLVDGAQGVCHMPVDVQALDVDSTPSPATRCSRRPASACCTARPMCWKRCRRGRAAAI